MANNRFFYRKNEGKFLTAWSLAGAKTFINIEEAQDVALKMSKFRKSLVKVIHVETCGVIKNKFKNGKLCEEEEADLENVVGEATEKGVHLEEVEPKEVIKSVEEA